jgi:Uma2 family endonuclease
MNGMRVDLYQRNERDRWEIMSYDAGDVIDLTSVNLNVTVAQIYEDIVFSVES